MVISLYVVLELSSVNHAIHSIVTKNNRLIELNTKLTDGLLTETRYEKKFIIMKDPRLLTGFEDAKAAFEASFSEAFSIADFGEVRKLLDRVGQLHSEYQRSFEEEAGLIEKGSRYAKAQYALERKKLADGMINEMKRLKSLNQADILEKIGQLDDAGSRTRRIALFIISAGSVFGIILSVLITRSITSPLSEVKKKTKEIANGVFDSNLKILSPPEIAELAGAFNFMEEELRKKRQELQLRAQDLEIAYKDIESFSYAVSHDLKAPIRRIEGFSGILLEDYADKINVDGKNILTKIVENTKNMGQLINDLLSFSRFTIKEIEKSDIDMESALKKVYGELTAGIAGDRNVQLEIESPPPAYGDPSMINQVLLNLLSNAIKFTGKRETAEIEAGGLRKNGENIYYVKDNGIGFDMQFRDKLFGLFQRIHASQDYDGSGVGLVIVKKIVEKHGGRVWAEGKPDEGATFYFSLPVKPAARS